MFWKSIRFSLRALEASGVLSADPARPIPSAELRRGMAFVPESDCRAYVQVHYEDSPVVAFFASPPVVPLRDALFLDISGRELFGGQGSGPADFFLGLDACWLLGSIPLSAFDIFRGRGGINLPNTFTICLKWV